MNHDFINGTSSTAFDVNERHWFGSDDLQTAIAAELTTRRSSQAPLINQLAQPSGQKTGTIASGIREPLTDGSDTFVLKPHAETIRIKNFNLREHDHLELAGGLTFDQISITQGTDCNTHNTFIRTKAGELLAVLENIQASTLNKSTFLTLSSSGSVSSQGDRAMKADIARERFRVDGTGVKVGVLSDSFDFLRKAAKDVVSGDLPANVTVLADYTSNYARAIDEGRAMLQIIHDVAPGATLLFHTAYASGTFSNLLEFYQASEKVFADGIRSLAAAGANVIVDDVGFLTEPMFQDGLITQAINEVVAKGVSYFTSAGNDDRNSYESSFQNGGFLSGYGAVHDFDPGPGVDIYQNITIPQNTSINLSFQWDSPIAQSPNDLNIYLLDTNSKVLAQSTGSAPIKILTFFNNGSYASDTFNLLISNPKGTAPERMKYIVDNPTTGFQINEYNTQSSTIFGHKNASKVVAVGAAPYYLTPVYGTTPAKLEPASSVGGTPILFDPMGNRLPKPEARYQPRIVAPDGANITSNTNVGSDIQLDPDNFPNFFGTSAAAPHAAAVAALLLQANPYLHPAEINTILEQTAQDMDDPKTPGFDVGFDYASGYGLIQVDRAVAAVVKQLASTHLMAA